MLMDILLPSPSKPAQSHALSDLYRHKETKQMKGSDEAQLWGHYVLQIRERERERGGEAGEGRE